MPQAKETQQLSRQEEQQEITNEQQSHLSPHDEEILSKIFSQELFMGEGALCPVQTILVRNRELSPVEREAAELEVLAIQAVEVNDDRERALELLGQAIAMAPTYPSPLNNRAQVYRLFKRPSRTEEARADLEAALAQATVEDFPLVRRQALSQRAWLHYADGSMEAAFRDFEAAAALGCTEAQRMAVRCNPYARLCNDIMQEMLNRLYYSRPQQDQ